MGLGTDPPCAPRPHPVLVPHCTPLNQKPKNQKTKQEKDKKQQKTTKNKKIFYVSLKMSQV
jgi:hypothetical protein